MSAAADRSRMKVTWCRIPNVDLLFRAERILRAATVDMFLAFAAGALRRHFRAQACSSSHLCYFILIYPLFETLI